MPSIRTFVKPFVRYFSIWVSASTNAVPFWPARRSETALAVKTAIRLAIATVRIVIAISISTRPKPLWSAVRTPKRRATESRRATVAT